MLTHRGFPLGAFLALFVVTLQGCIFDPTPEPDIPSTTVVVGSGGCDGQDKHCKDHKVEEKVMKLLRITEDGKLLEWKTMSGLPGLPAWFAVKSNGGLKSKNCLFVTYPDASIIGAFQWENSDSSVPQKVQTISVGVKDANPVFGDVSSDGNTLVVANYHGPDDQVNSTGASIQTFSISIECKLTPADLKPHNGSSINKDRQGAAHPHSAVVGRNNFVFVCDLGMDMIFTYRVSSSGKLTELFRTKTTPGSGPRHSVLHPSRDQLFVVSEMSSTVDSYHIEANGNLTLLTSVTTLPDADPRKGYGSKAAELAITPDGMHLYASNRAFGQNFTDTIAVFDILPDGNLNLTQQVNSPPFPRGMTLTPDGKYLLVASQTNSEVASFKVNSKSGHLEGTGSSQKGPWGAAAFAMFPQKSALSNSAAIETTDHCVCTGPCPQYGKWVCHYGNGTVDHKYKYGSEADCIAACHSEHIITV